MQPQLKPPGTKRFKLNCDILLSTSAFKLDLRRYNQSGGSTQTMQSSADFMDIETIGGRAEHMSPRHVTDTQLEHSSLELHGIL